jgi:DNA-binding Lrp family transcriptional regulator
MSNTPKEDGFKFITIPVEVLQDERLKGRSKELWAYLNFRCFNNKSCWVSFNKIEDDVNMSRKSLAYCLKLLEDLGYITIEKKRGKYGTNLYEVHDLKDVDIPSPQSKIKLRKAKRTKKIIDLITKPSSESEQNQTVTSPDSISEIPASKNQEIVSRGNQGQYPGDTKASIPEKPRAVSRGNLIINNNKKKKREKKEEKPLSPSLKEPKIKGWGRGEKTFNRLPLLERLKTSVKEIEELYKFIENWEDPFWRKLGCLENIDKFTGHFSEIRKQYETFMAIKKAKDPHQGIKSQDWYPKWREGLENFEEHRFNESSKELEKIEPEVSEPPKTGRERIDMEIRMAREEEVEIERKKLEKEANERKEIDKINDRLQSELKNCIETYGIEVRNDVDQEELNDLTKMIFGQ